MADKHQLVTGEACNLFNSGYGYSEGYNFYHCKCGKWKATATSREASQLFLAHVIQQTKNKA